MSRIIWIIFFQLTSQSLFGTIFSCYYSNSKWNKSVEDVELWRKTRLNCSVKSKYQLSLTIPLLHRVGTRYHSFRVRSGYFLFKIFCHFVTEGPCSPAFVVRVSKWNCYWCMLYLFRQTTTRVVVVFHIHKGFLIDCFPFPSLFVSGPLQRSQTQTWNYKLTFWAVVNGAKNRKKVGTDSEHQVGPVSGINKVVIFHMLSAGVIRLQWYLNARPDE